jgi:hypothetical protein
MVTHYAVVPAGLQANLKVSEVLLLSSISKSQLLANARNQKYLEVFWCNERAPMLPISGAIVPLSSFPVAFG